jgi:glycosyltransferase involved in cell wall biosynthesis
VKILTISNCPLDRRLGSGYVTLGFVEGLRQRGWTVDALGSDEIDPWPRASRARSWRMALGMAMHAIRRLRRTPYDIVEFYGGEAWLAISLLTRWPGRRFLVVSHSNGLEPHAREQLMEAVGTDTIEGTPRRWYQLNSHGLAAHGFRRADGVVTVSLHDRRYAVRQGYQAEERLLAIENPLPGEFLQQPVDLVRRRNIAYCGTWLLRKGTRVIVEDMSRVLAEVPDARLRLIGVGAAFRAAEHFPASVCGRIDVIPFLSDKMALRAAYLDCSVLIAPAYYESFGLTIAEAMACGCAVVTSSTGFAADLVDDAQACLLPAPQSPHLYDAVLKLLLDDARRVRIATAGYRRVQSLRWETAISKVAQAYSLWLDQLRQS